MQTNQLFHEQQHEHAFFLFMIIVLSLFLVCTHTHPHTNTLLFSFCYSVMVWNVCVGKRDRKRKCALLCVREKERGDRINVASGGVCVRKGVGKYNRGQTSWVMDLLGLCFFLYSLSLFLSTHSHTHTHFLLVLISQIISFPLSLSSQPNRDPKLIGLLFALCHRIVTNWKTKKLPFKN